MNSHPFEESRDMEKLCNLGRRSERLLSNVMNDAIGAGGQVLWRWL